MKYSGHCNNTIISSIPLPVDLKKYWVRHFNKLVDTQGAIHASDIFKDVREGVMRYIANGDRTRAAKQKCLHEVPVKRNQFSYSLLEHADSQPYDVLNFLKLYTSFAEPLISEEETEVDLQDAIVKSNEVTTSFTISGALKCLRYACMYLNEEKDLAKAFAYRTWKNDVQPMSKSDFDKIWARLLYVADLIKRDHRHTSIPFSDISSYLYADVDGNSWSDTFHRDTYQYAYWRESEFLSDFNLTQLVEDNMSDEMWRMLNEEGQTDFIEASDWMDSVGQIHYVHKKGTVKRRPIAVPNRYLQAALTPLANELYSKLRRFPQDATFDQNKFDRIIQEKLENDYAGSVDLSHATEYLPYEWFTTFMHESCLSQDAIDGLAIFDNIRTGSWETPTGNFVSWTTGQPLGTLPSFAILGLTHHIICYLIEIICNEPMDSHVVLGDDVVFFSRKVRDTYIHFMQVAEIPLSIHKSYEGNMCEFAGKIFIRRQLCRYSSDHAIIGWNSLFDYQRATKTVIPYRYLPSNLRRRWRRVVGWSEDERMYELSYTFVSEFLAARPDHSIKYNHLFDEINTKTSGRASLWVRNYYASKDEEVPKQEHHSMFYFGVIPLSQPVTLDKSKDWFKDKFRPVSTDKLASYFDAHFSSL